MAALLSVHDLPIVFSIHVERPSMVGLAYRNSDIILSIQISTGAFLTCIVQLGAAKEKNLMAIHLISLVKGTKQGQHCFE